MSKWAKMSKIDGLRFKSCLCGVLVWTMSWTWRMKMSASLQQLTRWAWAGLTNWDFVSSWKIPLVLNFKGWCGPSRSWPQHFPCRTAVWEDNGHSGISDKIGFCDLCEWIFRLMSSEYYTKRMGEDWTKDKRWWNGKPRYGNRRVGIA